MDIRKVGRKENMMIVGLGVGSNGSSSSALDVQSKIEAIVGEYLKAE